MIRICQHSQIRLAPKLLSRLLGSFKLLYTFCSYLSCIYPSSLHLGGYLEHSPLKGLRHVSFIPPPAPRIRSLVPRKTNISSPSFASISAFISSFSLLQRQEAATSRKLYHGDPLDLYRPRHRQTTARHPITLIEPRCLM